MPRNRQHKPANKKLVCAAVQKLLWHLYMYMPSAATTQPQLTFLYDHCPSPLVKLLSATCRIWQPRGSCKNSKGLTPCGHRAIDHSKVLTTIHASSVTSGCSREKAAPKTKNTCSSSRHDTMAGRHPGTHGWPDDLVTHKHLPSISIRDPGCKPHNRAPVPHWHMCRRVQWTHRTKVLLASHSHKCTHKPS